MNQLVDSVFVAHPKTTRHSEPWQWAHMRLTYKIRLTAEVITASAKNPYRQRANKFLLFVSVGPGFGIQSIYRKLKLRIIPYTSRCSQWDCSQTTVVLLSEPSLNIQLAQGLISNFKLCRRKACRVVGDAPETLAKHQQRRSE